MLYPNYDAFNITRKDGAYIGYIAEEDFFLLLNIESEVSDEEGNNILRTIKDDILNSQIDHLHDFDTVLADKIGQLNLPVQSSAAAGFFKGEVLFLKTVNKGEIYLNRGSHFVTLLSGNNTASGSLHFHDFLIVTTTEAKEFIAKRGKQFTDHLHTSEPRTVSQQLLSSDDAITEDYPAALFMRIEKREDVIPATYATPSATVPLNQASQNEEEALNPYKKLETRSSKKLATLIVATVLGMILVWSVGLGYQRREQQRKDQLIANVRTSIIKKLDEASDISFLNSGKAIDLVQEAKQELANLKVQLGNNSTNSDVKKLEDTIKQRETEITKKEEKPFSEFYDLTLDSKGAKGYSMFSSGDTAAILDTTNSKIYTLSLVKKSLHTNKNDVIKRAKLIALADDTIFYFVPNEGVYRIDNEGKNTKVIDDKSLSSIADIAIYNSNIYLLDTKKGNIYKYTSSTDGFSKSNSYFGSNQDFNNSHSLAIDSAIYIDQDNSIKKYSAGTAEKFDTVFPNKDVRIHKVITNADLDKVYAWDKENSTLYILGKDGAYISQIHSGIFKDGDDLTVFTGKAYVLKNEKVYEVTLE